MRAAVLAHFTAEPVAGQQHVADAEREDHQAKRGKAEKAETAFAVAHQFTVHHHVGRCGDQTEHATDQTGKTQRHHQPAGRDLHACGDAQHHRNENGHHPGGAHHRAQPGHTDHQQHQQTHFAVAGAIGHPFADAVGNAGAHQPFADHEQRGDQHHVGVAEAGQGFLDAEDAGQW
ncbi:hypothetical protein D3C75_917480 [compost metagenome]